MAMFKFDYLKRSKQLLSILGKKMFSIKYDELTLFKVMVARENESMKHCPITDRYESIIGGFSMSKRN